MILKSKEELIQHIKEDEEMMLILKNAAKLNLPDWWISAGFVRNKVWDLYHDYEERTPYNDIDVIYFDEDNQDMASEKSFEAKLNQIDSTIPWSVKNQARMHHKNNVEPYQSSTDAVNHYTEIPTAICVKLANDEVILHYDYDLSELFNGIVKPTPYFTKENGKLDIYLDRIEEKQWTKRWPKLEIEGV